MMSSGILWRQLVRLAKLEAVSCHNYREGGLSNDLYPNDSSTLQYPVHYHPMCCRVVGQRPRHHRSLPMLR